MRAKVCVILKRTNHPNTPQAEAKSLTTLPFRLMRKYRLDMYTALTRPAQPLSTISPASRLTGRIREKHLELNTSRYFSEVEIA